MRYCILMGLFVLFLIIMIARQETPANPDVVIRNPPRVVYRTVERPAAIDRQAASDLKYLSDVAERNEFRRRYRVAYGKECPY